MKMRLILPALLALVMFQLTPQAAWSHCGWHGGYNNGCGYGGVSRWQARQIYRAERHGNYGAYAPYGGGYPGYYNRGGFLGGIGRAIF